MHGSNLWFEVGAGFFVPESLLIIVAVSRSLRLAATTEAERRLDERGGSTGAVVVRYVAWEALERLRLVLPRRVVVSRALVSVRDGGVDVRIPELGISGARSRQLFFQAVGEMGFRRVAVMGLYVVPGSGPLLAEALEGDRGPESLVLRSASFDTCGNDVEALSKAMGQTRLRELMLSSCDLTGKQAAALARGIAAQNRSLTGLHLQNNKIKDAPAFFEALSGCATLLSLNLSSNDITDKGAAAFSKKGFGSLRWVDLSYNDIRDAGARSLATALKENRTLDFLGLRGNIIKARGITHLNDALAPPKEDLEEEKEMTAPEATLPRRRRKDEKTPPRSRCCVDIIDLPHSRKYPSMPPLRPPS